MSSQQSSVNAETIEQTKQQIRSLVSEISQLSKSELTPEEYYAAFLQRIVQALAAAGGAIWIAGEGRRLQLTYQINLDETLLDSSSEDSVRHSRLLNYAMQSGEGHLIPPMSGASDERAGGNPTQHLLVISQLRSDGVTEGLVEIFQRPDSPPATQRGYLRFLDQMAELAGEWLKTQKLRQFSDRHSLWAQADHFSRLVHDSLDLRETAYAVANEGRRLIGCDRVSVAMLKGGRKCVVDAVSGQDTMENRSNIVALLGKVASKVVATGEPLWYEGSTEDYPPQIEQAIEEYVDESYTKSMVVLPLRKPKNPDEVAHEQQQGQVDREHVGEVIGALIVEQIESELPRAIIAPRLDLVYEHSARALANSLDHSTLFLMPVWRAIGKAAWVLRARTLPKTLAIAGLILAIICILTFVQKNFYLKADGELQPVDKRDVFVDVSGIVTDVHVKDQQLVKQGDPLVVLSNIDLDVQRERLEGELQSTYEQWRSELEAKALYGKTGELNPADEVRAAGRIKELAAAIESLRKQLTLVDEKQEMLTIRSPIDGQVMLAWEVERSLQNRTVEVGQILMAIANMEGDWEVQLYMPERRMGHIDNALDEFSEPLEVSYILATEPKNTRTGEVTEVQRITQMHEEDGNVVRIRVDINAEEIEERRPAATVTGKVLCGRRAIGYAWFHEAVEWLQANVFF